MLNVILRQAFTNEDEVIDQMFLTHASCITLTLSRSFIGFEAGHITINDVGDSGSRTRTQMVSALTSISKIVRCSPLKLDMRACNPPSAETGCRGLARLFCSQSQSQTHSPNDVCSQFCLGSKQPDPPTTANLSRPTPLQPIGSRLTLRSQFFLEMY